LKKSNGIFSAINSLTAKKFKKYGQILELNSKKNKKNNRVNEFEILVSEANSGWRIAYLILRNRTLKRLERHPESKESFEPVKGVSLIVVAQSNSPEKVETFLLDKPVVLNKGVWHDVLTLSDETEIKITENIEVACEYHPLDSKVVPKLLYL